jgi:hypothetical protein
VSKGGGLFQYEGRTKGVSDFTRLRAMRDADIDDSDIPKLDESFGKTAKLVMPQPKDRLTIRLHYDVVCGMAQERQRLPDVH